MYSKTYGNGKTVLYLHGWGASGQAFEPVVRHLPNYLNITVDFYGFGNSPPPPEQGFTVSVYADKTAEFLRGCNQQKAVIVAHSFGCRVALVMAVKYPEFVDRMLLFAPAGLRRFSFKRWAKVRLYKLRKRLCKRKKLQGGSDDYNATPDALKSTFVKVVNQDLSAYARKIRCKTLIIAAKQDAAVPYRDAKRLHKLVKNSDFTGIDGDHFALFYMPEVYAKIIRLFAEE